MDPIASLDSYMTAMTDAMEAFDELRTWLTGGGLPPTVYYRPVASNGVRRGSLIKASRPLLGVVERDLITVRPDPTEDDDEPAPLLLSPSFNISTGIVFISKSGDSYFLSTDRDELDSAE